MDPLTALQVAGVIVQFVDFTTRIVSKGWKLHHSPDGLLLEERVFEFTTNDLMSMIEKLRGSLPQDPPKSLSHEDQALADLCQQCTSIGATILAGLQAKKIQGRKSTWKSFRQALKDVWDKEELEIVAESLESVRKEVETHILISLKTNMETLCRQKNDLTKLDKHTEQIITALLNQRNLFEDEIRTQSMKLSDMHEKTEEMMLNQLQAIRDEIHREYEAEGLRYVVPSQPKIPFLVRKSTQQHWDTLDWQDHCERIENILINGLQYPAMSQRYEAIAMPYQNTFEWIYQKPRRNWSNFVKWLREGNGIYWINGKAGSGKTTLMRYIHDNLRTRRELLLWAGKHPLQISSFFFWNSGTLEQKSQSGLLRSLLFEILSSWRKLIPVVLPEQWERRTSDHPWSVKDAPIDKWSEYKLEKAFQNLLQQTVVPLRLCLFIDGLDEYAGSHSEIVKLLKSVASSKNVKICLSSRPLPVFERGFEKLPTLRLQDLTFQDIRNFVTDKLAKNDQMVQLINEEPQKGPQLIAEIVTKAQGVFLWVNLVVASLLSGLQNFDRLSDLQRRVELLPPDLENLYKHMLQHIEPFYSEQASQIFQIVRAAREQGELTGPGLSEPLTILSFSFAEEEGAGYTKARTEAEMKPLTDSEILSRCEGTAGRIKSRCRGLLEVHDYKEIGYETTKLITSKSEARVVYLHRTVRDFLEEPKTWDKLLKVTSSTGFDVNTVWLKACLRRLKSSTLVDGGKLLATSQGLAIRTAFDAFCYATKSYTAIGVDNSQLLDELDYTMSQLYPASVASPDSLGTQQHWARGLIHDNPESYSGEVNLLSLALQFGLTYYVRNHLAQGINIVQLNAGVPLLCYAVSDASPGLCQVLGRSNKLETVAILLEHGAKPNQRIDKTTTKTVWQYVLEKARSNAAYTLDDNNLSGRLNHTESQDLGSLFELLIRYKADPNARLYTKPADKSALSALEIVELFQQPYAAELQALLLKSGAKAPRRDRKTASSQGNIYSEVIADVNDTRLADTTEAMRPLEAGPLLSPRRFLCFRMP